MPEYALRKTVGSNSAGTRVRMIQDARDIKYPIKVVNPGYSTIELPNGNVIDIEFDLVTKLRPRTSVGTTTNRRARRAEKRKTQQILEGLIHGD